MRSPAEAIEDELPTDVRKLQERLRKAEQTRKQAEQQAKSLQKVNDHLSEMLAKRSRPLFASPKGKTKCKGNQFHRVLIPDSHGAKIDKQASQAFLNDLEYLNPKEIVWLGDHLDCGGFLAQHHTIGFVAESTYSFADDVQAANEFIDAVQARTPNAVHFFLTGNHEHRIEKWCCQQTLSRGIDAQFLLNSFGVRSVLHLDKRGINYYSRGDTHGKLKIRGAIKLGSCYFVHDVSTSRHPADAAIGKYAANVMFGDTHRLDIVYRRKAGREIVAATCGHLSLNQPHWMETNVTDWMHAYAVQVVTGDNFLTVPVPIVSGKSLIGPLLGVVK
jgi:hypothetical protein